MSVRSSFRFALGIGAAVALAASWTGDLAAAPAATDKKKPVPPAPVPPPKPAPAAPGTTKPAPASPAAKPAPAAPGGDRIVKAITTTEKSEKAGELFRKFLEAKGADDRMGMILDPDKNGESLKKYFASSPNREFRPLAVQILGTVTMPSQKDRLIFPYFVATDKNKLGFLTAVVETPDGFKVDWVNFSRGHDQSLEAFLDAKKIGDAKTFLVGISKTHAFGDQPPGGEAKYDAYGLEMPAPRNDGDPPVIFIEKASEAGKLLSAKLGWSKGHLCYLTLAYEGGDKPYLKARAYESYAK